MEGDCTHSPEDMMSNMVHCIAHQNSYDKISSPVRKEHCTGYWILYSPLKNAYSYILVSLHSPCLTLPCSFSHLTKSNNN